jgi:hypothetical protein
MDRTLDVAQNSMTNLQNLCSIFFLAYIAAKIPGGKIAAGSPFLGFIAFLSKFSINLNFGVLPGMIYPPLNIFTN